MAALVSAAQRRKQRRLRSWWRHEQQSIAAVLATVTDHSFDKVGTANAALRGQKTDTSTRVPAAAEYFTLSDEEGELAGAMRPRSLLDPRPQGKVVQHGGIGYELVQALDAPMLQMDEEMDDLHFLHDPIYIQEQMIVQEIPSFPSVTRATQPADVEQVLNVPVLRFHDEDRVLKLFLEKVALLLKPEEQVSSSAAEVVQEQVIAQSLPQACVPRQRAHQRTVEQVADSRVFPAPTGLVEQMVDVPVPGRSSSVASERNVERLDVPVRRRISSAVSGRIVEQVVDAPVSRSSPSRSAHAQQTTGSSAAWLDASQGQKHGVFALFPRKKKCESRFAVDCGAGPAHQLMDAGGQ